MSLSKPSTKPNSTHPNITQWLHHWRAGDVEAFAQLAEHVYPTLRQMARRYLRGEAHRTTLQTTALVHEAFLRLNGCQAIQFESRQHFFNQAGRLMRRVLVERARARKALRRNGGQGAIPLHRVEEPAIEKISPERILALDEALNQLAVLAPRRALIVELKFFLGLSLVELALALGLSSRTVKREWHTAKLWLARQIDGKN